MTVIFFFFQSVSHIALAWEIVKMVSFSHQNIFFKPSSLFPQSFISNVFVCLTRSPFFLLWQQSHSCIVNNLSVPHLVGLSIMRPRLPQITEASTCSSRGNQWGNPNTLDAATRLLSTSWVKISICFSWRVSNGERDSK